MSMPASPELSGSVKRISAVPPPKIVWNAVVKLRVDGRKRLFELFLGDQVEFLDGLLRVSDRLQQVVAFARQESEALFALVELFQRHHVHRAHVFNALLHFAIVGFRRWPVLRRT